MVVPLQVHKKPLEQLLLKPEHPAFCQNYVAKLILTAPHRLLNASTVFAFERPFLAFLSLPTLFWRGTGHLSSKSSNHCRMETQASLYLVSQRPCERSGLKVPF